MAVVKESTRFLCQFRVSPAANVTPAAVRIEWCTCAAGKGWGGCPERGASGRPGRAEGGQRLTRPTIQPAQPSPMRRRCTRSSTRSRSAPRVN